MASIERRSSYNGSINYRVKIRYKGHPSQSATFKHIENAMQHIEAAEAALRTGHYNKVIASEQHTFNELAQRYITDALDYDTRSTYNQRLYLSYWREQLGDYKLSAIRPEVVDQYRKKLLGSVNRYGKSRGIASANRYTTAHSVVFKFATDYLEWMESNPATYLPKLREPRGRTRYLSDEERDMLLLECRDSGNPHLYTLVVLALSTGARQGELLKLRWKNVDLKRQRIMLLETKNGDSRALFLQEHAFQLMQQYARTKHTPEDLVFPSQQRPGKPIEIRKAWLNAAKRAKLEDFRFHDLRHTAASYLAMNGATLSELAEVLGHRSYQMVKRYAHLSESHVSQLVQKMNAKIFDSSTSLSTKLRRNRSRRPDVASGGTFGGIDNLVATE